MSDLVNTSPRIPKYIAIRDEIAHEIESGQLSCNTKLASERVLSEKFSCPDLEAWNIRAFSSRRIF